MDNFRRGLRSQVRVETKTGLAVCLKELKEQKHYNTIGTFLGPVTKSNVALLY
jgi:hypothetical protein